MHLLSQMFFWIRIITPREGSKLTPATQTSLTCSQNWAVSVHFFNYYFLNLSADLELDKSGQRFCGLVSQWNSKQVDRGEQTNSTSSQVRPFSKRFRRMFFFFFLAKSLTMQVISNKWISVCTNCSVFPNNNLDCGGQSISHSIRPMPSAVRTYILSCTQSHYE